MIPVRDGLRVERYQELNEPRIFAWRYLKKKLGTDFLFTFPLCWYGNRRVPTIPVTVTFRWRNRAHRVGEMIAYDEQHGYCLLGSARFPEKPKATVPDVRAACLRHGQAYVERLYDVAFGRADALHENSKWRYQDYKAQLRKKLGV